jgi:glutamate formiminotransferase
MRVLAVPNWSFGRNRTLLRRFETILSRPDLKIHFIESDVDHNRTVSAYSGEETPVQETLLQLASEAFEAIDLNRHVGVHPRIGALDVCPFLPLDDVSDGVLRTNALVERVAATLAAKYELPVFLYEKSERGRHESDLPTLRHGGFGAMLERSLNPDYGPNRAHPRLGVTVMGVRDFLLAINVNLRAEDATLAKRLAKEIRELRARGDERFLGVRAMGWTLVSRKQSQVSLNITLPDITDVDPVIAWVIEEARNGGVSIAGTELIGVIRPKDLPGATRLSIRPEQVVAGAN